MTNLQELENMLSALGDLASLSGLWDDFLGKTQNPPPDGEADGTVNAEAWRLTRNICGAFHTIIAARVAMNLERIKAAGIAKLTPAERSALGI